MSGQCVQCVQPCCMQDVWPGGSVGGQVWCTCASCMWQGRPVGGMEPVLSALTHSSAGCPTHSDSNIASFWIEWGAPFESFSSHVQCAIYNNVDHPKRRRSPILWSIMDQGIKTRRGSSDLHISFNFFMCQEKSFYSFHW